MPQNPKIMLLDDDPELLPLLKEQFAGHPFEAHFVSTGLDALIEFFTAIKTDRPFDALILDCALPRFDGFTIAKIVRLVDATNTGTRTKIGFNTAYSEDVERSTLLEEVQADAYFRKPIDALDLPNLVAEWLSQDGTQEQEKGN